MIDYCYLVTKETFFKTCEFLENNYAKFDINL